MASRVEYHTSMAEGFDNFQRLSTDNYIEFGLGKSTTIGGKLIYGTGWLTSSTGVVSTIGLSEYEVFAQRQLLRTPKHALSLQLTAGVPARSGRPDISPDKADVEFSALYGRDIIARPVKIFATLETGYRRKFGDGADQIRTDALIGIEPSDRFLVLIEAFSTTSMGNATDMGADYDVVKVQPSAVFRLTKRWSLQGGVSHEAFGRNLALGDTFFLSLWSKF